jgi:hypothetical protein
MKKYLFNQLPLVGMLLVTTLGCNPNKQIESNPEYTGAPIIPNSSESPSNNESEVKDYQKDLIEAVKLARQIIAETFVMTDKSLTTKKLDVDQFKAVTGIDCQHRQGFENDLVCVKEKTGYSVKFKKYTDGSGSTFNFTTEDISSEQNRKLFLNREQGKTREELSFFLYQIQKTEDPKYVKGAVDFLNGKSIDPKRPTIFVQYDQYPLNKGTSVYFRVNSEALGQQTTHIQDQALDKLATLKLLPKK